MKNIVYIILMGMILGFSACKSQDSIYEEYLVPNGLKYPGPALNPVAKSGKNRIEISWQKGLDPLVVNARIFWNNYTDSAEVAVTSGMDVISHIISPLKENDYSFIIRMYDAKGNASIPVEVMGKVYGEIYESSLLNRPLLMSMCNFRNELQLEWGNADDQEVDIELAYTDMDGTRQTMTVAKTENATIIPDFNPSEPLFYQTSYQPDSTAIDILFAPTVEVLIPPFEFVVSEIPKSTWKEYSLPGDVVQYASNRAISLIWDGLTSNYNGNNTFENADATLPMWITFDLGKTIRMNSIKWWHCDDRLFRGGSVRKFEIWGCSTDPHPNGSWDNWIPLGEFEIVAPSGAFDNTTATEEDLAYAMEGFEFELEANDFAPDPAVPVRYIRIKINEVFYYVPPETNMNATISEISIWGTILY